MENNYKLICHSCIKFAINNKNIYTDPFKIQENYNDADIILITHNHYDHFSIEDINKVKKNDTIIFVPKDTVDKTLKIGFEKEKVIEVTPNIYYNKFDIKFETIPAYNINKKFHPKENEWVGYIIEYNNVRYYIAGDTDITDENRKVKCDIAFVPVGGTYTMNVEEAADFINEIKPKIAIPIHYGVIVGDKKDAEKFKKMIDSKIQCEILF